MGSFILQMVVLVLVALLAGCYFDGLLVLLAMLLQFAAVVFTR